MRSIFFIVLIIIFSNVGLYVQAKDPGEKYNPTNLEWFAMDLNTTNPLNNSTKSRFSLYYYAISPHTLVLDILYYPDVDKQFMDNLIGDRLQLVRRLLEIKQLQGVDVVTDMRPINTQELDGKQV